MQPHEAIELGRQALIITLLVCAPILAAGLIVGLIVGLLQAITQVQDQTIAFVPKIVAMLVVLSFCLPWLVDKMMQYCIDVFSNVPNVIAGG